MSAFDMDLSKFFEVPDTVPADIAWLPRRYEGAAPNGEDARLFNCTLCKGVGEFTDAWSGEDIDPCPQCEGEGAIARDTGRAD